MYLMLITKGSNGLKASSRKPIQIRTVFRLWATVTQRKGQVFHCHKILYAAPMARPLRIELAGGLYHITSRGDGREAIYLDDADRWRSWARDANALPGAVTPIA